MLQTVYMWVRKLLFLKKKFQKKFHENEKDHINKLLHQFFCGRRNFKAEKKAEIIKLNGTLVLFQNGHFSDHTRNKKISL